MSKKHATEFAKDLAEMMKNWDALMTKLAAIFPLDTPEERYRRVALAFEASLGIASPDTVAAFDATNP